MTQDSNIVDAALLDRLAHLASRAAAAILAVANPALTRRNKADGSPVTAADHAAEAVILDGLARLLPGMPIVSEEAAVQRAPATLGERFLLVDPLDGTREYLAGLGEYTVNIALVSHHLPVAGVIAAPALGLLWQGAEGIGAERLVLAPGSPPAAARERTAIRTRARPVNAWRVLVSRSHLDAATERYVARLPHVERIGCGSSLKFCRLAEGAADLYPRFGPTSEWDVAAGHALVVAAGGAMTMPDGGPLRYGAAERDGFLVPGFIARGDRAAAMAAP